MKFRPKVPASRLALELLEQRWVLSAAIAPGFPSPSPVSASGGALLQDRINVSPGDGDILLQSAAPSAIVFRLGNGLAPMWSNSAVLLYRLGADGTSTSVFGDGQWPDSIVDLANNTVTIPLGGALEPGRYRAVLVGGFGSFSHLISNGSWDFMEDQTLAEFEVVAEKKGDDLDVAVDAGTAGPDARTFTGALTSAGDQAFYRVDLSADQSLWRLGLQLNAQRLGGGLLAALTVYDAQGNVLASSEGRRGLASAPNDPYLFVGLRPGTYYVGVSTAAGAGGAGAYQLAIAADPVVGPTRVIGFALDWTHSAPTGFTITFSDALDPDGLAAIGSPLWVVDAAGVIHPAHLSAAADGLRRLSFAFDQPLAAGAYTLVAPDGGGFVDLIGRAPEADGLPPGLLAKWTVAPYRALTGPESAALQADRLARTRRESLIDNAVGPGGALTLRYGVGTGTTTPIASGPIAGSGDPGANPAALGSSTAVAPVASFVGVLDSSLFGRPAARNDGTPGMGSIPAQGHALLAHVARERIAGETLPPSPADDGLVRSPTGALQIVERAPTLSAERPEPGLVEFPRGRRAESTDDGVRADVDALERIEANRLVDASARVFQWLFGGPVLDGRDFDEESDQLDDLVLAQIGAEENQRAEDSPHKRIDGGASRAGLGVPTGVVILLAVAYRLHRRPPQWWRRRRPTIVVNGNAIAVANADPRRPPVPRGPRYMVPKRARPGTSAERRRPRGR